MSIYDTSLPTWEDNQAEIDMALERIRTALISTEGMTVTKHPRGVRITVASRRGAVKRPTEEKRRKKA